MLVKTFQAEQMSEALRMVKAEMGLDAMILSSKKERRKGILGFFSKPYFEVTAALEPRPVAPRPNPYQEEQPRERELSTREEFQNSMLGPLAREVRELKLRVEQLTRKDAATAAPVAEKGQRAEAGAEAEAPRTFAKEELEEIKKLLYSAVGAKDNGQPKALSFPMADAALPVVSASGETAAKPLHTALAPAAASAADERTQMVLDLLAAELRAEELSAAAIDLLIDHIRPAADAGATAHQLRGMLVQTLSGMVKCAGSVRMKKNGTKIMAVVGPTGVGKTTTIAKLAALHALNRGLSVALITTDNFRVGAVEQLKTYAKIMDLPLEVVSTVPEMQEALAAHADKDLILIDTAGRSPKDSERIEELKGFVECHPGIETYLCVSATTRPRELDEIVAMFGALPIARLLFTKLDESESYGCIVDTHLKHKLPLSYFTTGQKVPEDIELATARRLATLVVKEVQR
ncbi:flagellar biosynthesis protein FlhF [Geomonas sp. Red276]